MSRTTTHWLDVAAIGASAACLVHCLALPLVIAALPLFSGLLELDEEVHRFLLAFAVPASSVALYLGHRRHRHAGPPAGGAIGLLLLASALLMERPAETAMTVAGSVLLALAHLSNWRMRTRCG